MKYLFYGFFLFFSWFGIAQQTEYVDFKRIQSVILFNQMTVDSTIFNSSEVKFDILKKTDSIYLDAINMRFINISLNGDIVSYKNDGKKLVIYCDFEPFMSYNLNFLFFASPKKAMYFIDWDKEHGNKQIWTQGQGKYTSNWLPSIDDMNDKIEFDLTFVAPKGYHVISNGKMISKNISPSYNLWEFDMQKPMSSYLVAVAIGKYNKKVEFSKSGIPLEMYYYPKDSLKFEPTYRYSKDIFDSLEDEIGVPYPWQNYKQVPVKDFLYAGMENTSATFFSDSFVIDSISFVDKNYINVNAHELAHQWFGDLITETSGTHHWLQEGFATYYALLAERKIFGDDYYYWRLYEYAKELEVQDKVGGSTSLLDPKSSSATFYKKGAWVLHLLKEKLGDKTFKNAIKNYLEKHQFKNVETDDFIVEVKKASGQDLSGFFETWLDSSVLHYEEMIENLERLSVSIKDYLNYDCKETPEACKLISLGKNDSFFKSKIIESLEGNISKSTFITDDVKVRQAIAQTLTNIPLELKEAYETLLDDASYTTIETALFNLCVSFPQDRQKYLERTKDIQGFNNKNVRILWLTLNLISADFEDRKTRNYYQELTDYTSSKYSFEIRQNAFQYLNQIQACNDVCIENLKQATKHHSWQFSKFAKSMLESINRN